MIYTYIAPLFYLHFRNVLYSNSQPVSVSHSSIDDAEASLAQDWPNFVELLERLGGWSEHGAGNKMLVLAFSG